LRLHKLPHLSESAPEQLSDGAEPEQSTQVGEHSSGPTDGNSQTRLGEARHDGEYHDGQKRTDETTSVTPASLNPEAGAVASNNEEKGKTTLAPLPKQVSFFNEEASMDPASLTQPRGSR